MEENEPAANKRDQQIGSHRSLGPGDDSCSEKQLMEIVADVGFRASVSEKCLLSAWAGLGRYRDRGVVRQPSLRHGSFG